MKAIALLFAGFLLAGCSSISAQKGPAVKLGQLKHLFVEHRLAEEQGIDRLITTELQKLGYEASYGPLTMMPGKVDAIVAYEERWAWDFKTYLIELKVELREVDSPKILATARYFRPAILGAATPEEMVHTTLVKLFKHE